MTRKKQIKEAHYLWAQGMARLNLNREPTEVELRSLGWVPFEAAAKWADTNPENKDTVIKLQESLKYLQNVEIEKKDIENKLNECLHIINYIRNDKYLRYAHYKHIDETVGEVLDALLERIDMEEPK